MDFWDNFVLFMAAVVKLLMFFKRTVRFAARKKQKRKTPPPPKHSFSITGIFIQLWTFAVRWAEIPNISLLWWMLPEPLFPLEIEKWGAHLIVLLLTVQWWFTARIRKILVLLNLFLFMKYKCENSNIHWVPIQYWIKPDISFLQLATIKTFGYFSKLFISLLILLKWFHVSSTDWVADWMSWTLGSEYFQVEESKSKCITWGLVH